MLCALIMAGGKGERFWPLSTEEMPKQFLKLLSDETMIQMTVKRLERLIPIERIFIVTGKKYVHLIKEQLPMLPDRNIIIEPIGKNTAPCIGLSAFIIDKYYKDATIAVVPSDHLIEQEEMFVGVLNSAYEFVKVNNESIVTLGMRPNRPETGYGYIRFNNIFMKHNSNEIREVDKFVEKPSEDIARKYIEKGNYLWNGGMFVWKCSTILKLTNKYLVKTYDILSEIAVADEECFENVLQEKYQYVESISVDYAIMEKASNIYVIPCDFGWDDIGSWHAIERYREKDENSNICIGDIKNLSSNNNIIIGNKKKVVIASLDNIFVVENDDMIFIGSKDEIDNIKNIKQMIS